MVWEGLAAGPGRITHESFEEFCRKHASDIRGWRRANLCGVEARQLAKRRAGALPQPAENVVSVPGFPETAHRTVKCGKGCRIA